MEIKVRTNEGVTILDMQGKLTLGTGEEKLRETVNQLLADGHNHLLLNFAGVEMVDSSGIGALIKVFTTAKSGGGKLKLLNVTRLMRQLLSITGLLTVFEIYDDEATALSSF